MIAQRRSLLGWVGAIKADSQSGHLFAGDFSAIDSRITDATSNSNFMVKGPRSPGTLVGASANYAPLAGSDVARLQRLPAQA
jgi:hypothetical protein